MRSDYHRIRQYRQKHIRYCVICGNAFNGNGNRLYCSKLCLSEHERERCRHYREQNLEKVRAKDRRYDAQNGERRKQWRDANREHLYEHAREYALRCKEKVREQRRKENAAMKIYREMGFSAPRRDRSLIYQALKAELPTI